MRSTGSRNRSLVMAVALILGAAAPTWAQPQAQGGPTAAMDDRWHFVVAPYMWFSGIKGDVSVAGLPSVPIEVGASDLLSNLDFGLAGRFEARRNRFGLGLDFTYNNLTVPVAADAPILGRLGIEADVRQLFAEGFGLYRVASGGRDDNPASLDVLVGARYTGTSTQLGATTPAGDPYKGKKQDLEWVDALAGARFRAPLGGRVALMGRADVAGFGSDVTWNLEGDLAVRVSAHWAIGAGWRYMDISKDEGQDLERKQFNLAYNGPRAWFAFAW